jgi:hypothetical protein
MASNPNDFSQAVSVSIPDACLRLGISRTQFYRELRRPGTKLRTVTLGERRKVVPVHVLRQMMGAEGEA